MTLAALWGDELRARSKKDPDAGSTSIYDMVERAGPEERLAALASVCDRLAARFRHAGACPGARSTATSVLTGDIEQRFDDAAPSLPIPFASSTWGSLAAFAARRHDGTAKYYGTSGNSFVAIVEFGDEVSARAVSTGGESGDPGSVHFRDQEGRYAEGALRKVYFYPRELAGHVEREYHPR